MCLCFGSIVGSLSVRGVAHARGGRVCSRLRRLALGALGSVGSQAVSAARSRRGGRFAGGSLLLPCLPWAAAQHGSAAAAQGSEVAGRSFGSERVGLHFTSKNNFYDYFATCRLSCVRRLLFSSAYRNPRRSLADNSSAVRSCFSVALSAAPSIPRIVRDRWRGDRGIAQGVSFRSR